MVSDQHLSIIFDANFLSTFYYWNFIISSFHHLIISSFRFLFILIHFYLFSSLNFHQLFKLWCKWHLYSHTKVILQYLILAFILFINVSTHIDWWCFICLFFVFKRNSLFIHTFINHSQLEFSKLDNLIKWMLLWVFVLVFFQKKQKLF